MAKKNKHPAIKITAENKCDFCKGSICCTYATVLIETPRSMSDFDYLLWQVSHAGTHAYKDEDAWYLLIPGRCQHLQLDGRCGIYTTRPAICRSHSNDYCEYDSPAEEGFELYFDDYHKLDNYCRKRFKGWDKRFKKL